MGTEVMGLVLSPGYLNQLVTQFQEEMDRGLSGEVSCLKMLPAYIDVRKPPPGRSAIAIDVGGSNLRTGLVSTDETGRVSLNNIRISRLPVMDTAIDRSAFFSLIAREVLATGQQTENIGFCFSYPMEHLPGGEAKVIGLTKEIRIRNLIGRKVGQTLLESLIHLDATSRRIKHITVLNDTVATLLAGMVNDGPQIGFGDDLGLIVGTGTNLAYVEDNGLVKKIPFSQGKQIINIESGGFNKIDQTDIDESLDRLTDDPGEQLLEKMVAGRYLADMIWETSRKRARKNLFSKSFSKMVLTYPPPPLETISQWREHPKNAHSQVARDLKDHQASRRDMLGFREIIDAVITRSAALAAVPCAAVLTKKGHKMALRQARIFWEGSLMKEFPGYQEEFVSSLNGLLAHDGEFILSLKQIPHSSLMGSGAAALMQAES